MPTVQQLEQRLVRVSKKMAARSVGGDGAALRQLHKQRRRLQRKLRRARPAPAGKPSPAPASPPADSQAGNAG
ncbi:MAG TPA: hypothetical protein VML36_09690 [Nitrospiria bacterium]|nr:hypothetical protein [Nitrospiria bacterium]